jgi:hypothetical protein
MNYAFYNLYESSGMYFKILGPIYAYLGGFITPPIMPKHYPFPRLRRILYAEQVGRCTTPHTPHAGVGRLVGPICEFSVDLLLFFLFGFFAL